MDKIKRVHQGKVKISSPHFLISYSEEYGPDSWQDIAVLSSGASVNEMKLQLLNDCIDEEVLNLMHNEIHYYLFELQNPHPISYLIYHTGTMSNLVYTNIHFTYVEHIGTKNLLYYIKTKSKQTGIINSHLIKDLENIYLQIITNQLFIDALRITDHSLRTVTYNQNLDHLHLTLYKELPEKDGFTLHDKLNLVEFAKWLSGLSVNNFSIILNHLLSAKLIKRKDIINLFLFHYQNQKYHRDL